MPTAQLSNVIEHLRRLVLLRDAVGLSDAQLLESYIAQGNEAAFEALVRRHGSMVLNVCRRTLRDHHDAEDAFQATFLVLARKASSIRPRDRVANWLHGVAHRTALKARVMRAKLRARQRQLCDLAKPQAPADRHVKELHELVDQELSRLADIYRLPILLCDLEGKSIKETTRQLGWPQGTVAGRLARGRKLLARRLARHGLALAGGVILKEGSASAGVPALLISSTVKAASVYVAGQKAAAAVISANVANLMEGVLRSMFLTKLKTAGAVLIALVALGVGAGSFSARVSADSPPVAQQPSGQKTAERREAENKSQAAPLEADRSSCDLTLQAAIAIALKQASKPSEQADGKPNWRGIALPEGIAIPGSPEEKQVAARAYRDHQRAEFTRQMHNLLLNTEVAYWNLYAAHGRLKANEDILHGLRQLSLDTEKCVKRGTTSPDLQDLQAQIMGLYHEFLGERTVALGAVLDAERNLRGIMGLPTEDSKRLIPVTAPVLTPPELPGWQAIYDEALSRRPELLLARENLRLHEAALTRVNDSVAPDLRTTEENKRLEPASVRNARLHLAQAYHVLKDQQDRVTRTLEQQYQAVTKYHRLIEDRRAERRAYADARKIKFSLVQLGKKSIDLDMLDVERRLGLAATKEYRAIAEYNNTLARLAFARGATLERHNVRVVENGAALAAQLVSAFANLQQITAELKPPAPAKDRIHLVTAHFDIHCQRLTRLANPDHMLLEGDVHLICNRNGQTVRMEGHRVLVRINDGTFTVEAQKAED